jgi:cobalamin biosynthesis protein CobD/CbiB
VDHTAADWDSLGLNFDALFKHVPDSAHPGQSQEEVVTILREQLTQALGKEATEGEFSWYVVCVAVLCVASSLLR